MKKFTAQTLKGNNIVSVFANEVREAKAAIREQLNRPGRTSVLKQWERNANCIKIETV